MKTGSLSPMSSSTADFPPEIPALVTSARPAWLPFEEPAAGNDEIRNNNNFMFRKTSQWEGDGYLPRTAVSSLPLGHVPLCCATRTKGPARQSVCPAPWRMREAGASEVPRAR